MLPIYPYPAFKVQADAFSETLASTYQTTRVKFHKSVTG